MNPILGLLLVIFLAVASIGAVLAINSWMGAYLDSVSWLIILGAMGVFDVFVLIKADRQSNSK